MSARSHDGLKKRCQHKRSTWPDCRCPWWFNCFHDGRHYRFSLTKLAQALNEPPPRSKAEAIAWRDRLRGEIRGGTFVDPFTAVEAPPAPPAITLTVGDVLDKFLDAHVRIPERSHESRVIMEAYIRRLRTMALPAAHGTTITLADKPIDRGVTAADLDVLRREWTLTGTAGRDGCTGPHRALKQLRVFFNWAIRSGYTEHTPFKRGPVATMQFPKEQGRTRRLEGDEEKRLLAAATTPLIGALIRAGLETGCRVGELIQLTWADVKLDAGVLLLPASITKTREARDVPITRRLRALLAMRRHGPDGVALPPTAYVFGNEVGEPVKYWRVNTAWLATCAAAGIRGLHFHDLRRELASTLRESGAPDHIVADILGHANISTTSRYLKATRAGLSRYMGQLEVHRKQVAAKKQAQQRRRAKATADLHTICTSRDSGDRPSKRKPSANTLN
jgi:integrase